MKRMVTRILTRVVGAFVVRKLMQRFLGGGRGSQV